MLAAYQLTWKAEELCLDIYPTTETNDESDGCRHFMWAAFLVSEFDESFAKQVLNAHEQNSMQPEKEMDLINNQLGIIYGKKWKINKNRSNSELINEFNNLLKNGKIIVLLKRANRKGN